jgi:hypothetical protein
MDLSSEEEIPVFVTQNKFSNSLSVESEYDTDNANQWVDFKLENVLVSLHYLKTMGLGSIIFKEWRVTRTFSYT